MLLSILKRVEILLVLTASLVFIIFSFLLKLIFFFPVPEAFDSLINAAAAEPFSIDMALIMGAFTVNVLAGLLCGKFIFVKAKQLVLFQALAVALLCGSYKILVPDLYPLPGILIFCIALACAASILFGAFISKQRSRKQSASSRKPK